MFERLSEEENIGPLVKPPRKLQSEAEHIHRAVYSRAEQLRKDMPNANIQQDLQDQEPRAVILVEEQGRAVKKEFFESTFSADVPRFLEDYVRAARECGHISVLYPGLSFPEDYVLRKVGQIYERIRQAGVEGEVHVHGYLYDYEGESRGVV